MLLAAYDWLSEMKMCIVNSKNVNVMKMKMISNSTKTNLVRFGAAFLILFSSFSTVSAQKATQIGEPHVSIRYAGSVDDKAQFQFDLVSDNEEDYLLAIQEFDGTILYKEKIERRTFTRKFVWNNADINSTKLVFSITGMKSKKTQVFEVNAKVRTVQDVEITKL